MGTASRYIDESADFWELDQKALFHVANAPAKNKPGAKPWRGHDFDRVVRTSLPIGGKASWPSVAAISVRLQV